MFLHAMASFWYSLQTCNSIYHLTQQCSSREVCSQVIPSMKDKSQWSKSTHGFFMHPPLLKATAGRPHRERHKGGTEKNRKKGEHKCPICIGYGC